MEPMNKMKKSSSKDVGTNLPESDNRPCFMEFTLHDGKASHDLIIPPNFVRSHLPETMPSKAILKGPSGDKWDVTLCRRKGDLVMQWHQFYQAHSLGDDEILLFRHNGDMCFDVQIFNKSGVERKNVSILRPSVADIKEEEIEDTTEPQIQADRKGKMINESREETNPDPTSRKRQPPASAGKKKR